MRPLFPLPALALMLATAACDDVPSAPTTSAPPRLDYMNGPAYVGSVIRWETHLVAAMSEERSDLTAIAGLPDDPTTHVRCQRFGFAGTEGNQASSANDVSVHVPGGFMDLGLLLRTQIQNGDVNIHVYRRSTFIRDYGFYNGTCLSPLFAKGRGRFMYTETFTSPAQREYESWTATLGVRFHGPVTEVETGVTRYLNAHLQERVNTISGLNSFSGALTLR